MITVIPEILSFDAAKQLRARIDAIPFVDGAATGGKFGRSIKNNEQLKPGPETQQVQQAILEAIHASLLFERVALPKIIKPPLIARYGPGNEYGSHVDEAEMSGRPAIRSDMSFTLFLEDPAADDGGELIIESAVRGQAIRPPTAKREILYELDTVRRDLFDKQGRTAELDLVAKSFHNLLRLWAEI
jgi:PKHD-type hydroxylase